MCSAPAGAQVIEGSKENTFSVLSLKILTKSKDYLL